MRQLLVLRCALLLGGLGVLPLPLQANTLAPPLPSYAKDALYGDYATGGNGQWNGASPAPTVLTDNNLDTIANSTYEGSGPATIDVQAAIFATPGSNPTSNQNTLGSTGPINFIRIYGQPAYNGDLINSYVVPPTQVGVKYDYNGGNPQNAYTINSSNYLSSATILSVNGHAPTFLSPGVINLTGQWQGPVADQVGNSPGAYYVDLGLKAIASTNGLYFDFGLQPNRSAGLGGLYVNEIQAALVPEPASLLLCGLGALGLFIAARRRG